MSDSAISDRTERALADIEAAGAYLRGAFVEAQFVKAAKVEQRVKTTPARMAEFNWGVFR